MCLRDFKTTSAVLWVSDGFTLSCVYEVFSLAALRCRPPIHTIHGVAEFVCDGRTISLVEATAKSLVPTLTRVPRISTGERKRIGEAAAYAVARNGRKPLAERWRAIYSQTAYEGQAGHCRRVRLHTKDNR